MGGTEQVSETAASKLVLLLLLLLLFLKSEHL